MKRKRIKSKLLFSWKDNTKVNLSNQSKIKNNERDNTNKNA